jgi:hypothetical protein
MDWSGLLLLTLLGHETGARVTSVSGNVLDQASNLTLGYFVFNSSIFISIYHFHAQSLIQTTRKRHNY